MHADVIILGHRADAHLLAYLFGHRGYRTLLISPYKEDRERIPPVLLLEASLARRFAPVDPPREAIVAPHISFQFWAPSERDGVFLEQLPYLVVDEFRYRRYLELQCTRTGNVKVLRGFPAEDLIVQRGAVAGVMLGTGDTIHARLVVECQAGTDWKHRRRLDRLGPFRSLSGYVGRALSVRRQVGTAASAWPPGTLTLRLSPGRHLQWSYRPRSDELEFGVFVPPGGDERVARVVGAQFRETGLDDSPISVQAQWQPYAGPPQPVPCVNGYLQAGGAAGHANGFLPLDMTTAYGGIYLAYVAATHALDEGNPTMRELWEYPRAFASEWGRYQGFTNRLAAELMSMTAAQLDGLFACGQLDTYMLSCLVRSNPPREEMLDALVRSGRGLRRVGALWAWLRAVRHARRVQRAFEQVPADYGAAAAAAWQESVFAAWQ